MFFITYSQEIMHLSFALGAILISFSITWLLYSVVSIVKDIRSVIDKTKTTLAVAQDVANTAKAKLSTFSIQFKALSSGLGTILDWIDKRKQDNYSSQTRDVNSQENKETEK